MVGISVAERASAQRRWLPVTVGYVLLLVIVTMALADADADVQERVIEHSSTNLHNLLHGHVGTLLSSAAVIGDTDSALSIVPLFACLLALAELRFGALQTVRVFLAGHIGATLLVALGLWVAVDAEWLPRSIGHAEDVGISYGAVALFGSLVALVPPRLQTAWATLWLLVAMEGVLAGRTFTNVGHLVSYGIGVALGVAMINRERVAHRPTWLDLGLLGCAGLLASTFLSA